MLRDFIAGARYLLQGLSLLKRPKIRRFVYIPFTINLLLFSSGIYLLFLQLQTVMDWLEERLEGLLPEWLPEWLKEWLEVLLDWSTWLLWPLAGLVCFAVVFFGFALIANLLSAPFNSQLAGAVEARLSDQPVSANSANMAKEIVLSVTAELRKLLYFALRAIPLLILFWIPGVQIIAPFLWFLFCAWMLTLEYTDYPMGNAGYLFPQQRKTLASSRMLVLGFGAAVMGLTMIPVINFVAMPAAVAGATALWVDRIRPTMSS